MSSGGQPLKGNLIPTMCTLLDDFLEGVHETGKLIRFRYVAPIWKWQIPIDFIQKIPDALKKVCNYIYSNRLIAYKSISFLFSKFYLIRRE